MNDESGAQVAAVVKAWTLVPGDRIVHDGQIVRVNATAQLSVTRMDAKSFEITFWDDRMGKYRRFRTRRSAVVARLMEV